MKKLLKNNKGVSLIEIVVAIALFATAIMTSTQIFQMAMTGQRNAIASQNVEDNLRYVFEVISKEIRYAQPEQGDSCGIGMADGVLYYENGGILYFKNSKDECVEYSLPADAFMIKRGPDPALAVTPNEVKVSDLEFNIVPYAANQQAQVTVKMKVRAVGKDIHKSEMVVQTTITPRYYKN
ncbi:hypothetical protein DRH27_02755 [Candidatus Falkowbacteria bacterium]|nr:MAG: hypothetical protein DRH27_02755 [Candidatus Falkowbacteria bacterium]